MESPKPLMNDLGASPIAPITTEGDQDHHFERCICDINFLVMGGPLPRLNSKFYYLDKSLLRETRNEQVGEL